MKIVTSLLTVPLLIAGSAVVFATPTAEREVNRLIGLLEGFASIVYGLIFIAVAFAFLWFFWGLAEFIRKEGGVEEAKKKIFWGLLAIFVLTSLWGIIYFLGVVLVGQNPGTRGDPNIQTFRLPRGIGTADDSFIDWNTFPDCSSCEECPYIPSCEYYNVTPPVKVNGVCATLNPGVTPTAGNGCLSGRFEYNHSNQSLTEHRWRCIGSKPGGTDALQVSE